MKKLLLLLQLLFVGLNSGGQTTIVDKQAVFGTWTKSKSPYIIEGEAIVPEGKTLKIKPGVVVHLKQEKIKIILLIISLIMVSIVDF